MKLYVVRHGEIDIILVLCDFDTFTVFSILASSLAELLPTVSVVVGDPPISISNLQLRSNSICPLGLDLLSINNNELSVQRPVIDSVCILLHSDNRRIPVGSVFSIVNNNRIAFGKFNGIANYLTVFSQRIHTGDVVVVLKCGNNGLQ